MSYKKLINRLKGLMEEVERNETDGEASRAILKGYWTAGQDVYNYTRETGEPIKNIALEAGMANGTLEKIVRFYRLYPRGYKDGINGHSLNWSHYAAVLYRMDKKTREFYLKNAAMHGWSSHELRRRIRNNYYENRYSAEGLKKKGSSQLKPIVQQLYTYAADVLKVVDGDTFFLDIDVGFFIKMEHKVRLRGINCAEKGTKKGDETKKFVEEQLRVNELTSDRVKGNGQPATLESANPIVIIRSYKSMTEKFGRYLVDLWYMKGETEKERILAEGLWLNQVLLDAGFARKVE